jgi:molybdenum cofactor biosynthesis enzyme MoaA
MNIQQENIIKDINSTQDTVINAIKNNQDVFVQSGVSIGNKNVLISLMTDVEEKMKHSGLNVAVIELPSLQSHIVFAPFPSKASNEDTMSELDVVNKIKENISKAVKTNNANTLIITGYLYNNIEQYINIAKEFNVSLVIGTYNDSVEGSEQKLTTQVFSDKNSLASAFEAAQSQISSKVSLHEKIKSTRKNSEHFVEEDVISNVVKNKIK